MRTLITIFIGLAVILPMSAARWQEAEIELSNGKSISGKLSLMGSRPLTITPTGAKYQQKILLSDIVSLNLIIREQSMNRPWIYKEAGKIEKMYLEGEYPFINFTTEIVLTNGQVVRGYIVSTTFKFTGKGLRKVFLTRQIKGKVGEKMGDLVYPVRIKFTNRANSIKPITVTLENAGKIQSATALDNEREVVHFAKIDGSKIIFDDLFPASYDIYILTDANVLGGLSDATPSGQNGEKLPPDALTKLKKVFPLANDFFSKRWILGLSGNTKFCKTLVYKRREKYYRSDKHTPGGWMWHLDIWSWHLAGREWKIDRRYIMVRHKQKGGEKIRNLYLLKNLGAVKPGTELNIDFKKDKINDSKFISKLK